MNTERFQSPDSRFTVETIQELLERLRDGESMRAICRDQHMPSRETVRLWSEEDNDLGLAITRARETGWIDRGERVVDEVRTIPDPARARVVLDAEKWFLGKLSRAFADKPVTIIGDPGRPIEHVMKVQADAESFTSGITGIAARITQGGATGEDQP